MGNRPEGLAAQHDVLGKALGLWLWPVLVLSLRTTRLRMLHSFGSMTSFPLPPLTSTESTSSTAPGPAMVKAADLMLALLREGTAMFASRLSL